MLRLYIKLKLLNTESIILQQLGNIVTYSVFLSSPVSPNTDTFAQMLQEKLIDLEHYIESLRYNNHLKSIEAIKDYSKEDLHERI
jgi:hypothetical protein